MNETPHREPQRSDDTGADAEADPREPASPASGAAPPTPGGPTAPPGHRPPNARGHEAIVWIVLLLLVAFTAALQFLGTRAANLQPQPSNAGPDAQLVLGGRWAVGADQLNQSMPMLFPAETTEQMLDDLQAEVDTPIDRLRLAILAGEVQGPDAARRRLEQIEADEPALQQDIEALRTIYQQPTAAPAQSTALDDAARQRLIDRHGWFGQLALSYGKPTGDPQRAQVLAPAQRTVWTLWGAGLGVMAAGLVGLVLFILAIVLRATGVLKWRHRPPTGRTIPLLESVAVFLLLMIVVSVGGGVVLAVTGINVVMPLVLLITPLALFWPLLRGMNWATLCEAHGWRRGRGIAAEAGLGIVGYLAGLPVVALGMAGTVGLSQLTGEQASHPIVEELQAGGALLLALILTMTVVWAPLVEESLFRGALFHHLRRGWGVFLAAVITGLLFAIIHPQGWVGVPALAALGGVLCYIRAWRGSVIGAMTAHALHNGVTIGFFLLLMG